MSKSIFDKIDRTVTGTYIFRLSLIGFLVVFLAVVAFIIKIYVFTASSNKGYIAFIIQNLVLSILLFASSHYIKRHDTKFALIFDTAGGRTKLAWLVGFTVIVAAVYELLKIILS